MKLIKAKKGQALGIMQATVLGIVTTVATLGIGYAVVIGLRDSQTVNGTAYEGINSGIKMLDIIQDNLGIIITIAVFTVVLAGIAAFGLIRASR